MKLGLGFGFAGRRGIPGISGTAPVLASLVNGETLSAKVTWGSYSGTGAVTTTKQMKLNAGSWVAYVGGTVVNTGEMWTVRELCSDTLVTDQPFTSGFQIVISTALVPSTFGIGDWVVNPTMSTGGATFTIYRLPADNGSAITSLQYRIGAGAWVSFPGVTVGNYGITGLTDGVQNSMTIRARNAISADPANASAAKFVTSQTSAALVTGNSATIVAGGVTWTLSSARDYGVTDTGIVTVDWTSGLTVLSRSPAATTDGGYAVNGTMKNPVRSSTGDNLTQGWHEAVQGWSAGANVSFPISTADGDIVVGAVNQTGSYADTRVGANASYSGLFFKSGGLPVNAVPPSMMGWAGRGTPATYAINIVDVAASMPSYALTGGTYPAVTDVIAKLDRLEIAVGATEEDSPGGYESLLTNALGAPESSNYGRYIGSWYGAAGLHLVGNVATAGQKQTLLKSLIRHGIQWFAPVKGVGVVPRTYGGHFQFHHIPVSMALHYLARGTDLDTMHTVHPSNIVGQTYTYTSTRIANLLPHSDTSKPMASRRRTIPGGGVSGLNITVPTDRTGGIGDLSQMNTTGMYLVRETPTAGQALVTAMPDGTNVSPGTSTIRVTIDVQPSPAFAASDVVYFRRPEPIYENDVDWRERNADWAILPGYAQEYRGLNFFSDDVLATRAQGIWRDAWDAAERYTAMANRSSDPSTARDYPTHHDTVNGFAFAANFWNTHAATVLGSYPVVLTAVAISGTGGVGAVLTATPAAVAPSAGLTRTYQWYNNDVAIGGQTATTYTVVAGDVGDNLTVWETIVNAQGTQISRSAAVVGNAGYTANAVNFDGSTWCYAEGLSGMPASTQGSIVFTFRQNTSWTAGVFYLRGVDAGGQGRMEMQTLASGALQVKLYNSSGTEIGDFRTSTSEFSVGTYYTLALSWDTVTQVFVARKRPDGGSWATVSTVSSVLTSSANVDAIGRLGIATTNAAGDGRPTNLDLHDVWIDFGQKPDFTNSTVLASFLPTVSKGTTGSLPTGTAPHFFFSGATASWQTNDGTVGGLTEYGAILTAGAQPT